MEKSIEIRRTRKTTYTLWLSIAPPFAFKDKEDEKLYCEYTQRQRQRVVPRLLAIGALLQAFAAIVPGERDLSFAYASIAVALVANIILAAVYICVRPARQILNHVAWLVLWTQLLVSASRRLGDSYNELLGWAVVLQYFTLATLPLHHIILMFYSLFSFFGYILVQLYNARISESILTEDFCFQVIFLNFHF